ncbi:P-loop containing nucleoside triphosphate hydrolase protein [Diplogelasinospora grovesii]|uniref:P-loop containing nucleoside triphosphate hydrolase protein n=1 Tax=Diplogelasinospora grovesii TaxID=303347 RepID=A0AAN6N9R2_9PEZI|nr:P-loop containing nucleoside triphosphate hydrolase protein [Diplogelasinospora grovesii]
MSQSHRSSHIPIPMSGGHPLPGNRRHDLVSTPTPICPSRGRQTPQQQSPLVRNSQWTADSKQQQHGQEKYHRRFPPPAVTGGEERPGSTPRPTSSRMNHDKQHTQLLKPPPGPLNSHPQPSPFGSDRPRLVKLDGEDKSGRVLPNTLDPRHKLYRISASKPFAFLRAAQENTTSRPLYGEARIDTRTGKVVYVYSRRFEAWLQGVEDASAVLRQHMRQEEEQQKEQNEGGGQAAATTSQVHGREAEDQLLTEQSQAQAAQQQVRRERQQPVQDEKIKKLLSDGLGDGDGELLERSVRISDDDQPVRLSGSVARALLRMMMIPSRGGVTNHHHNHHHRPETRQTSSPASSPETTSGGISDSDSSGVSKSTRAFTESTARRIFRRCQRRLSSSSSSSSSSLLHSSWVSVPTFISTFRSSAAAAAAVHPSGATTTRKVKILLMGDCGSGKTALINRLVEGQYTETTTPSLSTQSRTVSVLVDTDHLRINGNGTGNGKKAPPVTVTVEIWDLPGKSKNNSAVVNNLLMHHFFHAAVACFSVDDVKQLQNVCVEWAPKLGNSLIECPLFVLGTKMDTRQASPPTLSSSLSFLLEGEDGEEWEEKEPVSTSVGSKTAECLQAKGYAEVSAKTGEGVQDALRGIVTYVTATGTLTQKQMKPEDRSRQRTPGPGEGMGMGGKKEREAVKSSCW